MYSQPTSTPLAIQHGQGQRQASASTITTTNSDDPPERKKANHSRRSSSPFEVKLSATVSKRVSLDAFGGGLDTSEPSSGQEEVLEDIQSESEQADDDCEGDESERDAFSEYPLYGSSQYDQAAVDLTEYHATTLSTIEEVSSRDQEASILIGTAVQETRYFTPPGTPNAKPYVARDSPFLPPRKHLSAPPLREARIVIQAHEVHTKKLNNQLQASERVVTELQAETRKLRNALEEEADEKRKAFIDVSSVQRELLDLEGLFRDKENGQSTSHSHMSHS